jgi:hypothetical protein
MTEPPFDEDEPISLEEACRTIFKNRITPATLRAEAARGRLVIERIGRKDFVTPAAIREMRRKCQVAPQQKAPASGSNPPASAPMAASRPPAGASATTDDTSVALDSALKSVAALKKLSETTSRKSTRSRRERLTLVSG